MAPLLEVINLVTRFYTDQGVIHAVNGISYTLNEGETMAIVGESGSGKTVSALSVMGLIQAPAGRIEGGKILYRGHDLLEYSPEEMRKVRSTEIAMIFQDPMTSLNPVLTIRRQMNEAMEVHLGYSKQRADTRSIDLLRLVGIPDARDRLDDYPHQFSGGQRQRICIAMALTCNPSLLIADEPTTALDVTIQAQIIDLMLELKKEFSMAIIWITHDLGVVARLVEKVQVMYAGYIVEKASTVDLFASPSHPYTEGLLRSIPRLTARDQKRLIPIQGQPPDMLIEAVNCPFNPRCPYVIPRCLEENPPLLPVSENQKSACWRAEDVRSKYVVRDGEVR